MPSYTRHDTPAIVARVQDDLKKVIDAVREGDPHACAIILTGGFARGEGAVLDGQPQNDYDLIVVHDWGRPKTPYPQIIQELEEELGLHIDLARVARARLPYVAPTIFWYETALRGRLIWGDEVLHLIPTRPLAKIRRNEGLRLLSNRAAGLLLFMDGSAEERRLQASKALLAVLDARMLAAGEFPPSQTERWQAFLKAKAQGESGSALDAMEAWIAWAYAYKTDPGSVHGLDADTVWRVAATAILAAVPVALAHAGLPSLEAYGKQDGWVSRLHYVRNAGKVPGANRFAPHPTGTVRLATIHLLEAALRGDELREEELASMVRTSDQRSSLQLLEELRGATLQ